MMRPTSYLNDQLEPVSHRWRWFWWGVALQVLGVAIPIALAVQRARHDGFGGTLTRATVRLIWHQMAQHPGDVGVIVLGVAVFVAGSMVLARPLVRRRFQLVLAVPAAALLGFVVFGAVALRWPPRSRSPTAASATWAPGAGGSPAAAMTTIGGGERR